MIKGISNIKKHLVYIGKIILSVATIPLWFIRMFVRVGHLPNREGEIVEIIFRHSMFENVGDLCHPLLAYTAMAIAVVSAVANSIALKYPDNKTSKIVSNMAFYTSTGLFAVLLLFASTVARGY